jgi:hypothetical protein
MNDTPINNPAAASTDHQIVREVVGLFDTVAHMNAAVTCLDRDGIPRAALSVLGLEKPGTTAPRTALSMSDDPRTPLTAFVSSLSGTESQGVAIAIPMEIAGFGAAWAAAAAGGALLLTIGATVASGALGAGLGGLLYHVVTRHHAAAIHHQLAEGGLILWVQVASEVAEDRVTATLIDAGATSVHTHTIARPLPVT